MSADEPTPEALRTFIRTFILKNRRDRAAFELANRPKDWVDRLSHWAADLLAVDSAGRNVHVSALPDRPVWHVYPGVSGWSVVSREALEETLAGGGPLLLVAVDGSAFIALSEDEPPEVYFGER